VEGTTDHATVDTTGMTEGEYVVNATVDNNAKGKTRQSASCEAKFTVHTPSPTTSASSAPASTAPASVPTPQPPSLTIAATPEKLFVGDPASITAEGKSPAGYPLTYKCTTSAGHLTGDAPKYTLQTAGATPGTIQVDCTVSDDHSQRTTASASIEVRPHETARIPHKFATISFAHDAKRPSRVDNVAKAILDRYTDALAAAPDTKGVLVGYQTDAEAAIAKQHDGAADPGALRAANTKNYLSTEKGVDAARIELRSGGGKRPSVELWIVPRGEQFVQTHTTVVDESKIQPVPREALRPRKAAKAAPTKK
jgi:outer membrane protein OmpA-like peptidoglycan-associated protein